MFRTYLAIFGAGSAALAVFLFQAGTPEGPNVPFVENAAAVIAEQEPDYDQLAATVTDPAVPQAEVTRNATQYDDRVQSIVAMLNTPYEPQAFDLLATHRVSPGDSLTNIAQKYYGSPEGAEQIFAMNRLSLTPNQPIKVGQILQIPAVPVQN